MFKYGILLIFDEQIKQYANSQYYYEIDNAYKNLENWTDEDYQFVSKIPTKSFINCPISEKQSKYPVLSVIAQFRW